MRDGLLVGVRREGRLRENWHLRPMEGYDIVTEGGTYDPQSGFHVFEGASASMGVAARMPPGESVTAMSVRDRAGELIGRVILRPWRFRILRPERFAGRVVRCLEVRRGAASDGSHAYLLEFEDENDRIICNERDVERLSAGEG